MLISYKRGEGSIILRVKILNSSVSTGAGLTGLTSASAGLIISTIVDNEAAATAYTVTGSTVETIATLGTYAAPTATKCRFKEVDATNHKGIYEIQIADARFAVASAKSLLVSISGATNAAECDAVIPLVDLDPYDSVRGGLTALPNAAADAAGGLPISDAGGLDLDARLNHLDADITARTLLAASYFDPAADTVANVTTCATNTDMRGTDSAALAATALTNVTWTDARAGYLDNLLNHTAQTGDNYARIGAAGVGLSAIPWNAAWDAEVQSECNDALVALHLDHLLAVDYDPAAQPGIATALLNELIESNAGVSRYTADALSQAPSGTGASAATIADAVWNEAIIDHVAPGSFGKSDADILADTNELQANQGNWVTGGDATAANQTTIIAYVDELESRLTAARAGYLDNLLNHTAQTGDSYALANSASGFVATKADTAAIKVKTDYLPSVIAGGVGGVFIAGVNAETTITTALNTAFVGDVTGNLSGSVGSVTGAVGSVTGNVGGNVAGSVASVTDKAGFALSATGTDLVLVDGKTLPAAIQIVAAAAAGVLSGAGTGTEVCKGLDGTTTRLTATVDASGNRTVMAY